MAVITGTAGNDTLNGTTTDDGIYGLEGNDTLNGNSGNDLLDGGAGADILNGGAGTDTATYANSAAAVNVSLVAGVVGSGGDAEGDTLTAIERVIGSAFDDTLASSTSGHALLGGQGNDVYVVGNQGVTITEVLGEGDDEIRTSLTTYSMANYDNVERLTYTGASNATLTGNGRDNIITGGTGNDTLIGGAGADQLIGGAGTDTASYAGSSAVTINLKTGIHTGDAAGDIFDGIESFIGSSGNDIFVGDVNANSFNGSAGIDTIDYSLSDAAVNVNLTAGTGSGGDAQGDVLTQIERVIGSTFDDTLSSSTSGHTLLGGQGNDIYVVGLQAVTITEAAGEGDDEIKTSLATYSMASYANVERLTYTGTANASLTGNAGDNIITGGIGGDTLNGGAGADQLIGGDGNDTLIGGAGADELVGGAGADTASYAGSTAVTINLKTGIHTGDAAGDTFNSIEGFVGSSGNDTFIGDASANSFNGSIGTDTVDYSLSEAAVNVDLATGFGTGGDAQGDILTAIERVIGSTFGDTLAASTSGHALLGGQGDDIYVVGNAGVTITEAADEGDDEIRTSLASYSMANYANVERLTYTGTANASLTGNAGDNVITGAAGNDTLIGGAGADYLVGGAGTDSASYAGTAAVTINLKTGIHTGDAAGDTFDSIETFVGSSSNDTFFGDANANSFNGSVGTDTIDYSFSDAAVSVNLTAGTGSGGDAEGDVLTAIERVVGSVFDDTLSSSTNGHTLQGGQGNDVYVVGQAGVVVTEAVDEGDDEIRTSLTTYSMANYANVERLTYTGTANVQLIGNAGDNVVTGGIGNDTLTGGAGADQLIGGDGTDSASYFNATAAVTINLKTGVHTGDAAGDNFESIENFVGTNFGDTFIGDAGANSFNGGGGTDTIDYSLSDAAVSVNLSTGTGSGGDAEGDTLTAIERVVGSVFDDTLTSSATSGHQLAGGQGNDTYVVSSANTIIAELAGEGDDEIRASVVNYSMANYAKVERLTYTGTGGTTLTGNAGNNIITGNTGNDTLIGGAGADLLVGGAGTDTASYSTATAAVTLDFKTGLHSGDAAGDTFESIEVFSGSNFDDTFIGDAGANTFNGVSGIDTIDYSLSDFAVNVNLTTGVGSGGDAEGDSLTSIERVIGTVYDDTLSSSTANHNLRGGQGNDIYVVGNASVAITELAGEGDDEVRTALTTYTIAGNIERLTFTGAAGNATLTGNSGDNIITGGNNNDTLSGAAGNDQLIGGLGDDTLIGGAGADELIGGDGFDTASYATMTGSLGVTINLKTGVHTGDAAGDTFNSIERFIGTANSDTFYGDADANAFVGGAENDLVNYSLSESAVSVNLTGGVGLGGDAEGDTYLGIERVIGSSFDDTLASSTAGHILRGGLGNDIYVIGGAINDQVTVTELAGEGDDEIRTSRTSFSIENIVNVERLTYTSTGNAALIGNALDNTITGSTGNDTLRGGAGADYLIGGAGTDTASYFDSTVGIVFDLDAGIYSGIAAGDTFDSVERLIGSTFSDTFIGNGDFTILDGDAGVDMVSYRMSTSEVTINLATNVHTGDASGMTFNNIEILEGTASNDTFVGNNGINYFIGGAGADSFDGGAGVDGVWYLTSTSGVMVNLAEGTFTGGDAEGDTYLNIEGVMGSNHHDEITGSASNDRLEGGGGDDLIYGGDGDDTIYGNIGSTYGGAIPLPTGNQADTIFGGIGNDTIFSATTGDVGTVIYGEAGNDQISAYAATVYGGTENDTITVRTNGVAYGEDGNDVLTGFGTDFNLYGGVGDDEIIFGHPGSAGDKGSAFGGEGSDDYTVETVEQVRIIDDGLSGYDRIFLKRISDAQIKFERIDDDLYITTIDDWENGPIDHGVVLVGWYNGTNTIEEIITSDNVSYIPA